MKSIQSYIVGFVGSIVLTLAAYAAVVGGWWSGYALLVIIMGLALVQLVVQLVFFLHLGRAKAPGWNLVAFIFMLIVLLIIVAGSLWIMAHLNYSMMSPEQSNHYMLEQSKKGF